MRVMHFSPVRRADRSERVQRRRASWLACLAILTTALLGCVLPQVASAESELSPGLGASTALGASAEPEISLTPSTTKPYTLCPPGGRMIECNLIIDPPPVETSAGLALPGGGPLLEGGGEKGGFDPENLQAAYKIPTSGGSEETVALVDAYGYKSAESDLAKYRAKYKLAACTKASGCFKQVNEKGEEKNYPAEGGGLEVEWSLETSLDMDMISAACPNCKIMLVEATTQGPADTGASAEEAAKLKASEISNSYGYAENNETWCPSKNGCKEYLSDYNHAGIPVTVSSGDSGYDDGVGAPSWPATSPNVIAVGGTSLKKAEGSRGWSETVWSGSGSGCSLYEAKPTWQTDKGCTKRTDNDVAAVASPSTPVSVYNTPYYVYIHGGEEGGWINVGGTSVSSPFVAGIEAHATSATKKLAADAFYKKPSMLFHVSEGSNGSCGTEAEATYYLCHATKEGYNGPAGEGTPDGVFTSTTPPSVTTGSATSVTETGATLNGTVNPEGSETKYAFEYGTTKSYGTKTAEASAGSGTSNVEESKAITGLTASTTYYFRIVATNSEKETSYGTEKVFSTTGKPTVETKPATSIGKTEAALKGVVNPRGFEAKYYFEYGTTEAYGSKTAEASAGSGTSNVEESKTITGLTANTKYYFRIVASNTKGTAEGSPDTFTTLPNAPENTVLPVISPAAPVQGEPESTTNGTWTNSPTSYAYEWERCNTTGGECKEISGATSSTYTPVEADLGHTLVVKVTAKNSGGSNSATSAATSEVGLSITEYTLEKPSGPYAITPGPEKESALWFADFSSSKIGKITTSGTVTEYALPKESEPYGITTGPATEKDLWFTDYKSNKIGKITTSGTITEYALPAKSEPMGITVGSDGNVWYADYGTSKIGKITPSGTITEYALPAKTEPKAITAGPGGNLWYAGYSSSKMGEITTSGTIDAEYALPNNTFPWSIAAGPDGNIWYLGQNPSEVAKITPSGTITEYVLPEKSEPWVLRQVRKKKTLCGSPTAAQERLGR